MIQRQRTLFETGDDGLPENHPQDGEIPAKQNTVSHGIRAIVEGPAEPYEKVLHCMSTFRKKKSPGAAVAYLDRHKIISRNALMQAYYEAVPAYTEEGVRRDVSFYQWIWQNWTKIERQIHHVYFPENP